MLRTTFFGLASMAILALDSVTAIQLEASLDTSLGSDMEVAELDATTMFDDESLVLSEVDAQPAKKKYVKVQGEMGADGKQNTFTFINVHRDHGVKNNLQWVDDQNDTKNMSFATLKQLMKDAPKGTLKIHVGDSGVGKPGSIHTKMGDGSIC